MDSDTSLAEAHRAGFEAFSPAWSRKNPYGDVNRSLVAWAWDLGYRLKEDLFRRKGK